ncbi:MAG: hypothetical protein IJR52_10580 [Selenomonadaceae bacterium]|nr:hypothetical protein [Selenomonadaceae bacterium]MBQ9498000.1 hypothetical protein [Selenomonadaceae bacterium]
MTAWLDNVVALNVKPTTIQNYRSYFEYHIKNQLGEVKVQDLTAAILDKWLRQMQREGLAYTTILGILQTNFYLRSGLNGISQNV